MFVFISAGQTHANTLSFWQIPLSTPLESISICVMVSPSELNFISLTIQVVVIVKLFCKAFAFPHIAYISTATLFFHLYYLLEGSVQFLQ